MLINSINNGDWLRYRASIDPNKTALYYKNCAYTFGNLDELTDKLVLKLMENKLKSRDFVAIYMSTSLECILSVWACMRMGVVFVPINTTLTFSEIEHQLNMVPLSMILYNSKSSEYADGWVTSHEKSLLIDQKDLEKISVIEEKIGPFESPDLHSIVFTSGSSGFPKPVKLTYSNIFFSAISSAFRLGINKDDVWLSCLPLFHVGGLSILYRSVLYGTAVILHEKFNLEAINEALDANQVTQISLVPTMLYRIVNTRKTWPDSLRLILLGGASASQELIKQAEGMPNKSGSKKESFIATTYGLTEAASQVATLSPSKIAEKPSSVGKALMFNTIRIIDQNGEIISQPNIIGTVHVLSPSVSPGYYEKGDDISSSSPLIKQEFNSLNTGDIGYLDEEGDLFILQRRSDLIISGGENIMPAEVEDALVSLDYIDKAVVVGIKSDEWGQVVSAMIVPNCDVKTEKISDDLKKLIAKYKIPKLYKFVGELPENSIGKIDKVRIKKILQEEFDKAK